MVPASAAEKFREQMAKPDLVFQTKDNAAALAAHAEQILKEQAELEGADNATPVH
jgi:hypothetical protein